MLIFVLLIIIISLYIFSYPWPIRPFNTAHGVSGVLGDARGTSAVPRFHRGIDIPASAGTDVFSINSGRVHYTSTEDGIYIGNYWYIHISEKINLDTTIIGIVDTTNTSPTKIGEVSDDHLHFQIGEPTTDGPYMNPISYDGGLTGFSDEGIPIVYTVNYWLSGSDKTTTTQVESPIYGKIDIKAECRDRGTSGKVNTTTGIYRLEWLLHKTNTTIIYGPYKTINFNQVQPPNNGSPVLLVYDRHNYATSSPFHYWITNVIDNNEVEDRYWNTCDHTPFFVPIITGVY